MMTDTRLPLLGDDPHPQREIPSWVLPYLQGAAYTTIVNQVCARTAGDPSWASSHLWPEILYLHHMQRGAFMTVLRQVIQKMLTHPIESPCLPPRYNALRRVSNGVYKWAFLKPEQFEHPVAGGSPFIPTRSQDLYNRVYNYLIATHPKESGRVYAKDYMGMVPDLKDCARSAQESVLRTTIRRIEQAALLPESHAERRFLGWKEGSLHPRYHQLKIIKR